MIYFDNAATTPMTKECTELIKRYAEDDFFNPSAMYRPALLISRNLKSSREQILSALKGEGQLIFTGSGTEANNLALFGCKKQNGSRIVLSALEHASVEQPAMELKQRGFDVVYAMSKEDGTVDEEHFLSLINQNTSLVSLIHVNNETGAVNDIKRLCAEAKRINQGILFHSDGVQAVGKLPLSLRDLGVDLYTLNGHKIHAPKGVGALYVKSGIQIKPMLFGGGQEGKLRSSTENIPAIMAFTHAICDAVTNMKTYRDGVDGLNRHLRNALSEREEYRILSAENSSPYILSISLKRVRGEVMLHALEKHGVYIGTGSACAKGTGGRRLAETMKLPKEYENGIIRISFNRFQNKNDIEYFINVLNSEYNTLIKHI